MRRVIIWGMLLASVLGVFMLNYFSVPLHDELGYAFWEQAIPKTGPVSRVSSLADIVKEQYLCYFVPGGNGRVFVHAIVAMFSAYRAYILFDICNTGMWCLLVWLVLKSGGIAKVTLERYLAAFVLLFYLAWLAESCCQNSAYAVNYLWTTTMAIMVLMKWESWRSWWLVPLSFIIGWSQDSVVLPLFAALVMSLLFRSVVSRRFAGNAVQVVSLLVMACGVGLLCCGPAARGRAGGYPITLAGILRSNIPHVIADGVFCFTPMLVFIALVWILWCARRHFWRCVETHLETWMFVFFLSGVYFVVAPTGAQRLLFPGLVAGAVLMLANRHVFGWILSRQRIAVCLAFGWLLVSVAVQVNLGLDAKEMVRTYCADLQNVTFWRPRMNLMYSATQNYLYPIHWRYLQLECEKDGEAICLSPWFYENFYLNPERFFQQAVSIVGAESVYVSPDCPVLAVKRGADDLTDEQKKCVKAARNLFPVAGWRKVLPGRFGEMLPTDWHYVRLPRGNTASLSVGGELYTLYLLTKD